MFKKILLFAICFCMISASVFAASVTMEGKIEEDSVAVNIILDEIPQDIADISAITIKYEYDAEKLSYMGVTSAHCTQNLKDKEGGGYIGWFDTNPEKEDSFKITADSLETNGNTLFTINFKAKEDATGDAKINITFIELADSKLVASDIKEVEPLTIELKTEEPEEEEEEEDNKPNNRPNNRPRTRPSNPSTGTIVIAPTPVPAPVEVEFSDISKDNWAYAHAKTLFDKGIISGDGSEKPAMRPNANITREEAAKIALLAMGVSPDASIEVDFEDSDFVSDWAKGYIASAVKHGILKGSDGKVRPKELITREEMITILSRAMGWNAEDGELAFTDSSDVADWSRASVNYAFQNGILTGYSDNTIKPKATITRAETFALVARCLSK